MEPQSRTIFVFVYIVIDEQWVASRQKHLDKREGSRTFVEKNEVMRLPGSFVQLVWYLIFSPLSRRSDSKRILPMRQYLSYLLFLQNKYNRRGWIIARWIFIASPRRAPIACKWVPSLVCYTYARSLSSAFFNSHVYIYDPGSHKARRKEHFHAEAVPQ